MCERQKGANTQGTQVGSLASHETTKTKFHHQKDEKVEDLLITSITIGPA